MKNIIILGEEYWFEKENTIFTEATYLLKSLEFHRNKNEHNYIIIKKPDELIKTINELNIKTIFAIFLFQDVLSDSYLNNKTIFEMKKYMLNLSNNGIHVYPPIEVTDIFGSKKYNLTLNEKLPWAALPHTQVYHINNYRPYSDEKIITKNLYNIVVNLWKIFKKVVVKKGYSYEGRQIKTFNRETTTDYKAFFNYAKKLNNKKFWGVQTSSIQIDKGITRYYIIQGFNRIVSKKINEYRIFFHNGKPKFIAQGDDIPNKCIKDEMKKPLVKAMIIFAKKLFKQYIPLFWKNNKLPILFRIDVSYAVDPEFQDEYSINIEGFNNPIRIYANELEIDPTSYFYNKFNCVSDENFNSKQIQKNMAKYITKYIRKL